ncbi:uncharacterized protein LOC112591971 [Melanaphis sacchari]|uniref:uncharacterized protein LOC112591971 n=1 Tax=Melanaphis sacchari TaxID=742174 RepID=UPI000DC135AE|nr:uncharacterized protein LOC112591971 [Melanaphis sacchari]
MNNFKLSNVPKSNLERVQEFLHPVEIRKTKIKQESDFRRRKLLLNWELQEKRILNFKNSQKIKKIKKIADNKTKADEIKFRISEINNLKFYKNLDLMKKFKKRDKKIVANLKNLKRSAFAKKLERDYNRYWNKIDRHTKMIETNNLLIEKCVDHKYPTVEEEEMIYEIGNKNEEIEKETESSEKCFYIPKLKSTDRYTFIERIQNLRMSSNKCNQYAEFWEKTAPLWDKMTLCLQANDTGTLAVSKSSFNEEYAEEKTRQQHYDLVDESRPPTLVQEIMMNDVDYYISDEMVIETIERAKSLSEPNVSAANLIHLTKCIIEYEADVKSNVDYMVSGLTERAVFEFTKKKISEKIFVDVRRTIDRLQHLNDDNVIPTKLIKSKNKVEVTSFVCNMISNVDNKNFKQFDKPIDDDPHYLALISETADDRLQKFLWENFNQEIMSPIRFTMSHRVNLFEHVDNVVRSFLEKAHQKTAHFVSTAKVDEYAEHVKSKTESNDTTVVSLKMDLVYRICRKLTKLVFGMFATEERTAHNLEATVNAYVLHVSNRTTRVNYNKRHYKPRELVDTNYFTDKYKNVAKSLQNQYRALHF